MFSQEHLAQFVVAGSGMFKPEWFEQRYDAVASAHYRLPLGPTLALEQLRRFAVVDLAVSTKTSADYTVIMMLGLAPDKRMLVLDVDRARREGPDIVPAIQRAVERWQPGTVWIEKVAFQLAIVQEARRAGVPVRELVPDRDKVSRAMPVTAAFEGARLLLPRSAAWLRDLEHEVLSFPLGQHDDQVDCLGYAVAVGRTINQGPPLWTSYEVPPPDVPWDPRARPQPHDSGLDWRRGGRLMRPPSPW
jgi:predicted phage terminase large subunit-like protein